MLEDFFYHRVTFRMHTGHVQRVVATAYAQKTGALLECFGAETGDIQQLFAVAKRAVAVAPAHHRLRQMLTQTGDLTQQRHAGGIQIHTDGVHAILYHGVQAAVQIKGVHVVLVLAYAYGFRINLDQLGQGILQTPRNAGRAAQRYIDIGHFLAGQFTCAVHRSTRLADHHFLYGDGVRQFGQALYQFSGQFVGLPTRRAVANGNQAHAVRDAQLRQRVKRAFPIATRFMRIHRVRGHQFAGRIDHGHFHAGAYTRVQSHDHTRTGGCSQQQIAQVVGKHFDRDFVGRLAQAGQ